MLEDSARVRYALAEMLKRLLIQASKFSLFVLVFVVQAAHASDIDFTHAANPLDITGQQHNDTLDNIARSYQNKNTEAPFLGIKVMQGLAESYCSQRVGPARDTCKSKLLAFVSESATYYPLPMEELLSRCGLDPIQAEYVVGMSSLVTRYSVDPSKAVAEIRKIEERAQRQLNKKQVQTVLALGAVARYSIAYWHDAFSDPDAAWGAFGSLARENSPDKICKSCLVDADMRGALVGYTLGGSMGSSQISALFSFFELAYEAGWW